MADEILARGQSENRESKFLPHPTGTYAARCIDVVALGDMVTQWAEEPARVQSKGVLIFHTTASNEDGTRRELASREFTISMGEKANLRHFLEAWRGKPYTEEQVLEGVPLGKLVGQTALVSVAHKTSQKGRTYAVIQSIMPLPKEMPAPLQADYQRAQYWEDKKKEIAKATQDWRASAAAAPSHDFDDFPDAPTPEDESDQSLPF